MKEEEWFRAWFGEEYLALYPHRDRMEARRAVELLFEHVAPDGDLRVLDLGCGAGRHLRELERHGVRAVGLDLSSSLLRRAREGDPALALVRGDMRRLPFASERFRLVTSFFTSFGYFESDGENRAVLEEARRLLRPGGHFFLDFLNAPYVVRTLSPRDVERIGTRRVVQERVLVQDERFVEKRIRIERQGAEGGEGETFLERVRLYRREELEELLGHSGFVPQAVFGDYDGAPLGDDSPRCILLARAKK